MGLPRIFLYVVGRIMTALLAGFGFALDYTGESVLTISPSNWGLIGLIAFIVFVVITVVRELDLVLQQRPKISIEPKVSGQQAILEIYNTGEMQILRQKPKLLKVFLRIQYTLRLGLAPSFRTPYEKRRQIYNCHC